MANPSLAARAAIQSRVTDWSPDDATIAASLNVPTEDNPEARLDVPRPFLTRDLMTPVGPASLAKLQDLPSLARLLDDILLQDASRLDNWLGLLTAGGTISPTEAASLAAVIHATQPDPAWSPQVSWALANLGRPVDPEDIAESRSN